jgi:predicted nucleotidyltransferase
MKKTILEAVVGSTVHGTAVSDGLEDLDLMAVVLEDQKTFAGFNATDTWTARTKPMGIRSEAGDVDWVGYGLRKYLSLALKGNPSILLALFAPQEYIRERTPEGEQLQALAPDIVSKAVYMPFRGYMRQQHERLLGLRGQRNVTRPELVDAYGYDTKYASHVIRLGIQGEELLLTGKLSLPMKRAARALIVRVRTGGYSLAQVSEYIISSEQNLDNAFRNSKLPDRANYAKVEQWMLGVYLAHWQK